MQFYFSWCPYSKLNKPKNYTALVRTLRYKDEQYSPLEGGFQVIQFTQTYVWAAPGKAIECPSNFTKLKAPSNGTFC